MAAISPEVLVAGEVREVNRKTFFNRETGAEEFKGHTVTVLTRAGFFQFTAPPSMGNVPEMFPVGSPVACWVTVRQWSFGGREGVSYTFARAASPEVAQAITYDMETATADAS